jgi:hypothetical protein
MARDHRLDRLGRLAGPHRPRRLERQPNRNLWITVDASAHISDTGALRRRSFRPFPL